MSQEPRISADWPAAWHVCPTLGRGVPLKFAGACRDGATTACRDCGQPYVYRKPRPGRPIHGQTAGPRDHF